LKLILILLSLLLTGSVAQAAEPKEIVLAPGVYGPTSVPLGAFNARAIIGAERISWPVDAVVKIELFLEGVRICTVIAKGGPSIIVAGVPPQTSINCPIPGPQGLGRKLTYILTITGGTITTRAVTELK
jgi:hypothetical protein